MNLREQLLLVVLGAGASFDSGPGDVPREPRSLPPPLAKDLVERHFDYIAGDFPRSRPVIDWLRTRKRAGEEATSIEVELASLVEQASNSREVRQQLMAFRFYLHAVVRRTVQDWVEYHEGFTHYGTLLNGIYRWHQRLDMPVRFLTFNYDVMLDLALTDFFGWQFGRLFDYIDRADFRLFKLHGSTNWSRLLPAAADTGASSLDSALEYAAAQGPIDGPILQIDLESRVNNRGSDGPSFTIPAIAVPVAEKIAFECPGDHISALRDDLPRVTHVLIIGWRAAESHAVRLFEGDGPTHGLMPGYRIGLVTGSREGGAEVARNLGQVWEKATKPTHLNRAASRLSSNGSTSTWKPSSARANADR